MKPSLLLASLVLAVVPGTALAQTYDQTLPMTSSAPADGGRIDPVSAPVPWEVDGSVKNTGSSLHIAVSTANTLGPDGTFEGANVKDFFALYETVDGSGDYTGQSVGGASRWQNTPGTYYWMAYAEFHENPDDYSSPVRYYRSKVFTLHVGGPAVPTPTPTQSQPQTAPQPAPLTPAVVAPATTLRVYSTTISHGHAKLQATCTPAPCTLQTASWVKIGARTYPGEVGTTRLATSLLQHFYVTLPARTLRAIRAALKHHQAATLAVAVGTLDGSGAVADRDLVSLRVTKIS